ALDGGERPEGQALRVGVGPQLAAVVHRLQAAPDPRFPLSKARGQISARIGPDLRQFTRERAERAPALEVPLLLERDHVIAPGIERFEAIEVTEIRLLR